MKCIVIIAALVAAATAATALPYSANSLREGDKSEALVNFVKKLDRSKRQIYGGGYDDYQDTGSPFGYRPQFGLGNPYQGGLGFDTSSAHSDAHNFNIGVNLPFGSFGISAGNANSYSDHFGIHGKK